MQGIADGLLMLADPQFRPQSFIRFVVGVDKLLRDVIVIRLESTRVECKKFTSIEKLLFRKTEFKLSTFSTNPFMIL